MNKYYIYIGIALAILIVAVLMVVPPEYSLITGPAPAHADSKIMSITQNGDIVLSDSSIKNINDYIADMKTVLRAEMSKNRKDCFAQIENRRASAVNGLKVWTNNLLQQRDYLKNKDKVAFTSHISAGVAKCRGSSGVGDCRAIVSMFNPEQSKDSRWKQQTDDEIRFRVDSSGGWKNDYARKGKIYLVRAD